jgi:hypothetical protein
MKHTPLLSSGWGRRVFFLAIALEIPLVLSAATIPLIDLGPGSGGITFGVSPATVSLPSDITGSGSDHGVALPWSVMASPSSTFDLVGGDVQSPSSTESMTFNVNDGALGDSITGAIVTNGSPSTPDFFTFAPDGTGGDLFTGTVQVTSVTEGALLEGLGLTPAALDGTDLTLKLHVDCGETDPCIASTDPQGTIIDATIGPPAAPSSVPEPSFIFLLAGALVALPLLRLLKSAS